MANFIKIEKAEKGKTTMETVIIETDFEKYEKMGWKAVDKDWTKNRKIKEPVDSVVLTQKHHSASHS